MTTPQQPELRRSEHIPEIDLDAVRPELQAHDRPDAKGETGPVPKANKPGSASGPVQDKPDLDAMAEKLGTDKSAADRRGELPDQRMPRPLWVTAAAAGVAIGVARGIYQVIKKRT